jgi:hypothetical protein
MGGACDPGSPARAVSRAGVETDVYRRLLPARRDVKLGFGLGLLLSLRLSATAARMRSFKAA